MRSPCRPHYLRARNLCYHDFRKRNVWLCGRCSKKMFNQFYFKHWQATAFVDTLYCHKLELFFILEKPRAEAKRRAFLTKNVRVSKLCSCKWLYFPANLILFFILLTVTSSPIHIQISCTWLTVVRWLRMQNKIKHT